MAYSSRRRRSADSRRKRSAQRGFDILDGSDVVAAIQAAKADARDTGPVIPYIGVRGGVTIDPRTGKVLGPVPGSYSVQRRASLADAESVARYFETGGVPQGLGRWPATYPRYVEGDQFAPFQLDTEEIIALQLRMEQAGLYSSGDEWILGEWLEADADAYKRVLTIANRQGITAEEALERMLRMPRREGQEARRLSRPLVVTLASRDDIELVTRSVARELFGRSFELPPEVIDEIHKRFNEVSAKYQAEKYNLDVVGGVLQQPPSEAGVAQQVIKERYPLQVQYDEFNSAMQSILAGLVGER